VGGDALGSPLLGSDDGQHLAGQGRRIGELLLQVAPVGDDHDLEALEPRVRAHLANEENHGEALPAALGVPDDAATAVLLPVLQAGLAGEHALRGPELLVAADDLQRAAAGLHEQGEVPDDVQQVGGAQHPRHQLLLTRERRARLAQLPSHLGHGHGAGVHIEGLPPQIVQRGHNRSACFFDGQD